MPKSGTAPERAGLRVIRTTQPPAWEWIDGLRVATPAETLLACARDLGTLDLLVLIDSSLCEREGQRGTVTFAELGSAASRRAWGAPRLREASKIADSRADSAWETLLRALHWACEIDVEPQFELFTDDGRFVARGDLWLKGTTRFHEYDGGDHLARKQQRKDRKRDGRIDDESWSRRGYTAEDVLSQATRILRDADEALGREHDPTRIRAWNALLRQSLFTPAGMARFCRRLGLAPADEDAA